MSEPVNILHVDDDPDLGDLTATFLEREDSRFTVQTATSPAEGLDSITEDAPNCIVSDYDMPGKNGVDFLRTVRKTHPDIPFILFTGKGSEEVASEAISAGVTDYLQKESGTEQYKLLANRIGNAVEGRRAASEAERQQDLMSRSEVLGSMGGWELHRETETLRMTSGLKKLYGFSEAQNPSLSQTISLYDKDSQKTIERLIQEAVENGYAESDNLRFQRADGQDCIVEGNAELVENGKSEPVLRGVIRDKTEQYKRREELEQIETLFEHTQGPLFLIGVDDGFTIERVNQAWEEATGVSSELSRGQTPRELLGEKTGDRVAKRYRECVERQEPLEYEEQLQFGDDLTYWETRIAPVIIDADVKYIAGSTLNVTESRERQRELRRLQQAIDGANVAITLADPSKDDNPLVYVNDAYEQLTGYSTEEALGRNCRYLQGEETDPERVSTLREAIDEEEPVTVELRNYRKDGTEFWNRLTVTPIYDDDGTLIRYLGTQEEITDRKARERQLLELNETTQRLSKARSRREIAEIGTEAARNILGLQANSLHFATEDGAELEPAAQTTESASLIGDAPTLSVEDSIAGRIYRDGEPTAIEDVHQDPDIHNPETNLRGHFYLPLGDHGVLIAGSAESAAFNDTDLSVGDLLAGNLVAALDRVKHAETARQRREQLSLLFEESPLGAVQWDEAFRFDHLNERAQEILGYSEDDLRGESWERIVADGDHDQVQNVVEQLLDADGGTKVINTNTTQSGEVRTCEWHNRAVTGPDGEVRSVFSKFYDVTDRERYKQQLQEYETVLKTLSDAVYVLDEDGHFTYVNDEFVELVGYERQTIIENTPSLFKDEETVKMAEKQLGRLLSEDGPETVTFEATIQPRDGDPIVCEDHMSVLPYESESFEGSVGTLRDITERKERTQEIEQQNKHLDEFTSVVSHDLRNPLLVAEGRLELARAERDSAHLADIADAIERSQALIDDLLTLARGGDTVGSTEEVHLSALAEKCWQVVPSDDATLTVDSDRAMFADRSRFQQLLENLFTNAVEHGGEDVTISVGELDDGFYIADDGAGIPEREQGRIFEAGYSTVEGGTGFGLRIVKQIVEAHGWEIRITESANGGAQFEFTEVDTAE